MRWLVKRRLIWAMAVVMLLGVVGAIAAVVVVTGLWPTGGESQRAAAGEIIGGGGGPPSYLEPVPIVLGDYVPPWEKAGAAERGMAADIADSKKPRFAGAVGEFRLYGFDQPFSVEKKRCVAVEFPLVSDLKFNYLPPGTMARGPQYAGVCADGSVQFVLQEFITRNTSFNIGYEPGERAFAHDASAERISAATIGGRPAVVIRPPIEEGFGRSWAAIATDNGFIVVDAHELPLSETIKIAEGVECESC
jgi:hypothetical protein